MQSLSLRQSLSKADNVSRLNSDMEKQQKSTQSYFQLQSFQWRFIQVDHDTSLLHYV